MNRSGFFVSIISLLLAVTVFLPASGQSNLYLVFLHSNPDRESLSEEKVAALQQGHLDNIGRLYDNGDLLLAGPFDGGGGIFVLKAEDLESAKGLLASDPAISANRFIIKTLPMYIEKGMICKQDEPYEMISFKLVQYHPEGEPVDQTIDSKPVYSERDNVLFAFNILLNGEKGFIEVLDESLDTDKYLASHPLVKSGQYSYTIKKWWSTNKTFCKDEDQKLNY